MRGLKEQELQLLTKICKEHQLPLKLVHELKKTAEKFSYENASQSERRKEYTDLIRFYSKTSSQGD